MAASVAGKSSGRYCYREVLPFAIMVIVECANVGNSTLFKAASDAGASYMVFVVYSFAISVLSLLPLAFLFHRKTRLPPLSSALMGRICLLVVIGLTGQTLGYKGIQYSSPTMASSMSNLTPAFTFALAIAFRMEKLALRSLPSLAKIIGTVVSISGALVVVLYEGPAVVRGSSHPKTLNYSLGSDEQSDWVIGGVLLVIDYILISIWYIVQAQTARLYPAEFFIVFLYNLGVTLLSAPVYYFMEPDLNAWRINSQIVIISLLYAGVVSTAFGIVVHTWSLRVKGPVYVASFRPLSIAIAAVMGVLFLGDTLFLGSVIGAILIAIGFYVVLWGKVQEDMYEDLGTGSIESPDPEDVPLLR
ncbi:OLC1v1011210C1 [Oldenlandia corymbosa var. corymbosa]|uniref:WAT1-related protein n=1 Tax=Oldenlandia corymbosa var. corymbosa TaxID=529605 RepID=A0AAV1DT28_OLDCO|nr:OLC1v1011210C1 [Oldenlandia corymbosa var. corymbosa]